MKRIHKKFWNDVRNLIKDKIEKEINDWQRSFSDVDKITSIMMHWGKEKAVNSILITLAEKIKIQEKKEIVLEEAGVNLNHQDDCCDHCGKKFENKDDAIKTCSYTQYLTLCDECYRKAWNSVR